MNVPVPKVGPKLASTSPSQQSTFKRCARRHWIEKRAGLRSPPSPANIIGEKTHKVIEGHYETGALVVPSEHPPEIQIALQSFLQLQRDPDAPKYRPGLLVEHPRNFAAGFNIVGVPLKMRIDLLEPPVNGVTKVTDWKSSKWSSYRKTGEELLQDEQCVVYTKYAFEKIPGTEAVVFAHGALNVQEVDGEYIPTDPITRDQANEAFARIVEPTVPEMQKHFAVERFEDTAPNFGACGDFGGCPWVGFCGVVLPPRRGASSSTPPPTEGSSTMTEPSLKERLAAKQRATGINPSDAAKPTPVTPYVPPVGEAKTERIAALQTAFTAILDELRALGVR